ncbi:hypothetical protein CTA1_111 [Colletotrichum tanaceti]|uniref:C2H2-type domain-containing protein n=1 Tax=Colletotrichum tanaceti TaxID=1306861 RepID=A0A4U6X0Y4_9PEZI|nr:hypothetical protein CTA1_111 [Colletotrichum tanaceti]
MANLPKATDMEMDPTKQGQMVSPRGQENGVNIPNPSGQLFHQKTPPLPWGLLNFYGEEQPWVPAGIFGASHQGRQAPTPSTQRRTPNGFQGWRSTLPSECDTGFPPSDSGYESRTKHSIENTSVFNDVDRSQDTQSLSGQIMDYHPFGLTSSDGNWDVASTTILVPASQTSAVENTLICPDCQSPCKTRSELNKHHQRHLKAHKCDVPGCARTEGFGTLNDLDRHKGSVHPGVFNGGPRYRCIIGPCQTKDKIWPRADNFRQHLKRVHRHILNPEDDLSRFMLSQMPQRSHEDPFQHNAQDALEGVGSELSSECPIAWDSRPPAFEDIQLSPSQEEQPESIDLILDPSLKSVDGSTSDVSLETGMVVPKAQLQNQTSQSYREVTGHEFVQPNNVTRAPSPKAAGSELEDNDSAGICASQFQYTLINPSSCLEQDAPDSTKARERTFQGSPTDGMDCDVTANDPVNQDTIKATREDQSVDQDFPQEKVPIIPSASGLPDKVLSQKAMFNCLSQMPKNVIEIYLRSQAEAAPQKRASAPSINANNPHQCPRSDCQKLFNRNCELKKHMKRHDKPYGCTFPDCYKRFGSKNDWKRHENSQHFQVEMWKCHEKRADANENCGKVCLRRETFRSHLLREHKMEESSQVDKELEKCRVGRDGEARFWCGFCVKIVDITQKGPNAWAERFDHIDHHYAGRNNLTKKSHSDWVPVGSELADADHIRSSNASSDAGSVDENLVAVAPRSPQGRSGQTRKRSLGGDDDERPKSKRARTCMWRCCTCQWELVYEVNASCINCSHMRCSNCDVDYIESQDNNNNNKADRPA